VPTQVEWDSEAEMILHVKFFDHWTWDEVHPMFDQVVKMMESTSLPVSMIADFSRSGGIPADALTHALSIVSAFPANWELTILIGGGAIVRALVRVFSQLHPTLGPHLRVAASIDDALAQIASYRKSSG
jgi:hypothetical protein